MIHSSAGRALKSIALYEASKGGIVIIVGLGLLANINRDFEELGEEIVHHLRLNPAHHYPRIFLHAMDDLSPERIKWMAAATAVYSLFRFIEAYGLWFARHWAEWVAMISCAVYLPVEFMHLANHLTVAGALLTTVNVVMVIYFIRLLLLRKKANQLILCLQADKSDSGPADKPVIKNRNGESAQ
ncbi:MAG: DUF2127 domain-containing protein [Bdellovibrionales bacterium]|nr:DUF2127 domain-containing protein [Bdellovibrionales bacterium]